MMTEEDAVSRAETNELLIKRCGAVVDAICVHMQQFPSSPFQEDSHIQTPDVRKAWLEGYYQMNEQVLNSDKFSVSDLLFVTLCYLHIAAKPSLRICPVNERSVRRTLDVLRFMGSQHTPETVSTWPKQCDVANLFDHVAWITVSTISSVTTATEKLDEEKELGWVTSEMSAQIQKVKSFADPPRNSEGKFIRDIQLGEFWADNEPTSTFVVTASRVLHGLMLESYIIQMYPIDEVNPVLDFKLISHFDAWLVRACKLDSSDDFAQTFRNTVFDILTPINSRANTRTRKQGGSAGDVVPLTLLQFELGFDVAEKLNNDMSVRVRNIGFDTTHVFYDILLLHMFGHMMLHELRVDFNTTFLIQQINLLRDLHVIKRSSKFGRNREPLILRLQRGYFVHYISSESCTGRFVACKNTKEACLFWLLLLAQHNENELITGHSLKEWSESFLNTEKELGT